jgi:hypothetical protein
MKNRQPMPRGFFDVRQTSPLTSSSEEPRRMRNLEDLYNATQVMENTTLFCFFAYSDPLNFNEAIIEEK